MDTQAHPTVEIEGRTRCHPWRSTVGRSDRLTVGARRQSTCDEGPRTVDGAQAGANQRPHPRACGAKHIGGTGKSAQRFAVGGERAAVSVVREPVDACGEQHVSADPPADATGDQHTGAQPRLIVPQLPAPCAQCDLQGRRRRREGLRRGGFNCRQRT